jgi:hypothetical protein
MSAVAGFYRTCVIDGVLDHSPAEHVRPPTGPDRVTDASAPDADFDGRAEALAVALASIDAVAFADPDNWWSLVFEQMEQGLL